MKRISQDVKKCLFLILALSNPFETWDVPQSGKVIYSEWCSQEPNLQSRYANLDHENNCWTTKDADEKNFFICESMTSKNPTFFCYYD